MDPESPRLLLVAHLLGLYNTHCGFVDLESDEPT